MSPTFEIFGNYFLNNFPAIFSKLSEPFSLLNLIVELHSLAQNLQKVLHLVEITYMKDPYFIIVFITSNFLLNPGHPEGEQHQQVGQHLHLRDVGQKLLNLSLGSLLSKYVNHLLHSKLI